MDNFVYLDHSATTPTDPRVVEKMLPFWTQTFGNPSSLHKAGKAAASVLNQCRETVAQLLNCDSAEVIFTSGGTEADNLALRGVGDAVKSRGRGNHIIVSAVEHHAVLDVAKELGEKGYEVTFLPVDQYGRVSPQTVLDALRPETIMVSVIYANNEVGTINPIAEIGAELKQRRIRFHTDAVQAPGLLPIDIKTLNVDMMTLAAHKFYGPKGIGLLYARRALPMHAQILGGGQQYHRRSGTEPIALIVGLTEALALAESERQNTVSKLTPMRDDLIRAVLQIIPEAELTGHPTERLPGHTSFTLRGLNGDSILLDLNEVGFGASGGSACTTGQQEPSHVLVAMGVETDRLMGQVRFVLGKHTTQDEIDRFLYHLSAIVKRHRTMVPQIT
jgi:cysteine desulfurase